MSCHAIGVCLNASLEDVEHTLRELLPCFECSHTIVDTCRMYYISKDLEKRFITMMPMEDSKVMLYTGARGDAPGYIRTVVEAYGGEFIPDENEDIKIQFDTVKE